MEIIKLKLSELKPYEKNAKKHPQEQIDQIKKSIEQFGMNDPIGIWKDNTIIEGHGRYEALKQLGYEEVDCVRLDHLTDEERKAYTLAHNKLTMNSDFELNLLNEELESIEDIDMTEFGFNLIEELEKEKEEKPEVGFTEVLGEEHNYVVLYFDNEVDWLQMETLLDIGEKKNLSTRKDGTIPKNMERRSIGRVFKGKEVLEKIREHYENIS